jgi:hypothetical protein
MKDSSIQYARSPIHSVFALASADISAMLGTYLFQTCMIAEPLALEAH